MRKEMYYIRNPKTGIIVWAQKDPIDKEKVVEYAKKHNTVMELVVPKEVNVPEICKEKVEQ